MPEYAGRKAGATYTRSAARASLELNWNLRAAPARIELENCFASRCFTALSKRNHVRPFETEIFRGAWFFVKPAAIFSRILSELGFKISQRSSARAVLLVRGNFDVDFVEQRSGRFRYLEVGDAKALGRCSDKVEGLGVCDEFRQSRANRFRRRTVSE